MKYDLLWKFFLLRNFRPKSHFYSVADPGRNSTTSFFLHFIHVPQQFSFPLKLIPKSSYCYCYNYCKTPHIFDMFHFVLPPLKALLNTVYLIYRQYMYAIHIPVRVLNFTVVFYTWNNVTTAQLLQSVCNL